MVEKPNRRWFQIHLSTAVLLMFASGEIVWANVSSRVVQLSFDSERVPQYFYGWPYNAYIKSGLSTPPKNWPSAFYGKGIVLNPLVGFAILIAISIISEWLIRRREAQNL